MREDSGEMPVEKRKSERLQVGIPIELKLGTGITRDCCIDGVFFETDQILSVGEQIEFVMKMEYAIKGDSSVNLRCQGEVVRIESGFEKMGVAVSITRHLFDAAPMA
jgi:hypothetical protein